MDSRRPPLPRRGGTVGPRLAGLAACAALAACAGAGEDGGAARGRVLVVAVDGLEWDVVLPLFRAGELPALADLLERGTGGLLETIEPTRSPVIWTTIATGKPPEEHGILDFARETPDGGLELFTSRDRRVKALWDVAGERGASVAVVGWWMTWPVDEVNGVMVAQTNTLAQLGTAHGRAVWKGTLLPDVPDQVFPPARTPRVLRTLREAHARIPEWTAEVFGPRPPSLSPLAERLWENCLWSFRADATYARIAEELLAEEPWDLACVYFGGPDVVGHQFWRYREPELYRHPPGEDEVSALGDVLDDDVRWVDRAIGRLVAAAGPEVDVLVVSDHGMGPVNRLERFDPDDPPRDVNSAHHRDAPPGVLVAAGPRVRRGPPELLEGLVRSDLPRVGSVFDLAPTVLALLRIPAGEDMPGAVLEELLVPSLAPPPRVPSHDTAAWRAARAALPPPGATPGAEERLEQLRALGYVGDDE